MNLNIFKQSNKIAVLTGATGGLGKKLVSYLLEEHYKIIMIARNLAQLEQISLHYGDKVIIRICDISHLNEIQYLCEDIKKQFHHIKALIHCAGNIYPGSFSNLSDQLILNQLQVNLNGAIFLTKGLLPLMRKKSSIVFINSLGGIFPLKDSALYSASKYGLRGFALALAMELRPRKIYVSSIFPGAIDTQMLHNEMQNGGSLLNFCSPPLEPEIVCKTIMKALKKKGLEYYIPKWSGLQTKLLMLKPYFILRLMPFVEKFCEKRKKNWQKNNLHS